MALREEQAWYELTSQAIDFRWIHKISYLEIKGFITVENQNEASKLVAKGFDGLGLPSSRRPCYLKKNVIYYLSPLLNRIYLSFKRSVQSNSLKKINVHVLTANKFKVLECTCTI